MTQKSTQAETPQNAAPPAPVEVVCLAASAGGMRALSAVLSALPADFPPPILVVQHLAARHPSRLAAILGRRAAIAISEAVEGEPLECGHVYIAPAGRHLEVGPGETVHLTDTPAVNYVRPSADVLFKSAAQRFGAGVVAVVLTGTGIDGAAGIVAVKQAGGRTLAQEVATAEYARMPTSAINTGCVDTILALEDMAAGLIKLANGKT